MTLSKTPHGPERSITLTCSDTSKATVIGPFAGGVSFLAVDCEAAALLLSLGFAPSSAPVPARAPIPVLSAAVVVRNRRRFIVMLVTLSFLMARRNDENPPNQDTASLRRLLT